MLYGSMTAKFSISLAVVHLDSNIFHMRKYLIAVFSLIAPYLYSQQKNIDSLHTAIAGNGPDSNKVKMFLRLAHAYVYSRSDSCYYYCNKGLKLSREIKNKGLEAACLSLLGASYAYIGDYPQALHLSLDALMLSEITSDQESIYDANTSVGAVYFFENDSRKALGYFVQTLEIADIKHDDDLIANAAGNMGACYSNLNMPDSSLYYTNRAYKIHQKRKDEDGIANDLNSLGYISEKLNNNTRALTYYQLAEPLEIKTNDITDLCQTTLGMAGIYQKQNKKDSAYSYAYRAMNAATSANFNLEEMQAVGFIASLYESERKTDSAFKYLKMTMTLKDTLFGQEKAKSIQNMTFQENIRQQEIADQTKKAVEARVRNLQLLAIGVFIPLFFIGVLMLSRTKVKPRIVEFLGILSLLLFFEFITDLIYPYVGQWTNENPIWEMLFLVSLAALLEPLNFKLEHWVKHHLVHKHITSPISMTVENTSVYFE
jgi:tetratricopeptide (TPR) repeat protein